MIAAAGFDRRVWIAVIPDSDHATNMGASTSVRRVKDYAFSTAVAATMDRDPAALVWHMGKPFCIECDYHPAPAGCPTWQFIETVVRALENVEGLAATYDRSENWRTWGVPQAIRRAASGDPTYRARPDEPQGLGAVVADDQGRHWTRYDTKGDPQPWWCDGAGPDVPIERRFAWSDLAARLVLSWGVEMPLPPASSRGRGGER